MALPPLPAEKPAFPDLPTLAGIGIVAYVLPVVLHETLGHGLAAWLFGAHPDRLTSIAIYWPSDHLPAWQERIVQAAGSTVNLLIALLALALLRSRIRLGAPTRYFCWLLAVLGFLAPGGYLCMCWFFGDWHAFSQGLTPDWFWKGLLTVIGVLLYTVGISVGLAQLRPFLPAEARARGAFAHRLCLTPYLAGGMIGCLATGLGFAGVSMLPLAMGAYFGGFSALAWMHCLVSPARSEGAVLPKLSLSRNVGWIVAGIVVAALFIGVLGPGVHLHW